MAPQPSTWRGRSEQISLDQVGCEARKIPAEGDVFFLDFYLYRTYRELPSALRVNWSQIENLSGGWCAPGVQKVLNVVHISRKVTSSGTMSGTRVKADYFDRTVWITVMSRMSCPSAPPT
jgi:hypothetical protein